MGGMWIIGLFLAFPLLLGVATTGRRLYGKLRERGMEQRKATTVAFVSILLLAGVLSSPWMMPFGLLRIAAGISYLYFLYVGGKTIIDFFYGGPAEKPKSEDHVDCGCDHGDGHAHHSHGSEHHADAHKHDDVVEGDKGDGNGNATDNGSQSQEPAKPAKRDPKEIREELKRRQQNGGGDSK